jgi:hypothetical protein
MRELKQDWRDIFGSFRVAFDVWKLVFALGGVILTAAAVVGLMLIPADATGGCVKGLAGWVIPIIVAGLLLLGLFYKFAHSETGLTASKILMLGATIIVLGGLVALCVFTDLANQLGRWVGIGFIVAMIWAFFGGAVSRIAVVEIASDDRISLGEAGRFACRKYGACLGATVLPCVAVLFLGLCCALFGVLFSIPHVSFFVTLLLFFLVPVAGFLIALIALGAAVGWPLMYPAVAAEANDSFDAISRAYSYVFGRPWRFIFYNIVAKVYGGVCILFVVGFVAAMLCLAFYAVDYGSSGHLTGVNGESGGVLPIIGGWMGDGVKDTVASMPSPSFCPVRCLTSMFFGGTASGEWYDVASAWVIAIVLGIIGALVVSYVVSLLISLQATIYLLLRKAVDSADMTEVYREEDEETYAVAPEEEKKDGESAPPAAGPA